MLLSVIIPTRNRSQTLSCTLDSIKMQTIDPKLFEVIVIDNRSTDSTRDMVDSFSGKIPNLRYFYEKEPGLHVGRHKGLKEAKGNILVYADDDIEAFPTWLEGIVGVFEDKDVVLVGGKNLPKFETEPPDWIMKMWLQSRPEGKILGLLSILDLGDSIKVINPFYVFGCNYSIRKSIVLEAGGFHPDALPRELVRFRGDGESYVSRYIMENGYKALYYPKTSIFHYVSRERMTLKYFYHRAYIQGISDSFVQTRNDHGIDSKSENKKAFHANNVKIYDLLKHGRNKIINRAIKYRKKIFSSEYDKITYKIKKMQRIGFTFHQNEVHRDPKLLEWVLRKNYLGENGKLPE